MDTRLHRIEQLDRALGQVFVPAKPRRGWLQAIREALGITTRQLADRLNLTQGAIVSLERSEALETASLQTLRRAAEAMNCDFVYVIVPRKSLAAMVDDQAEKAAKDHVSAVAHTMALEGQATTSEFSSKLISEAKRTLLEGRWSRLW